MAILQGFPPSNTISPGVRIAELDLSLITPAITFSNAGIVGFASKGPINQPTLIQSQRQLSTVFGYPHPDVGDPYLIYAAQEFLLVATTLYVVRVAQIDPVNDEAASLAQVNVPAAGSIIQIESKLVGPYTFSADSFFRWRLNGILSSKSIVVLADSNRPAGYTNTPYAVADLVADLNSQLSPEIDGIQFFVTPANTIGVETVFAYGPLSSLELVSVQNSIYGNTTILGNPTGLGTGMTAAAVTGTNDRYPNVGYQTPGHYDFTGLTGLNLQIVIDGTDNVLIDQIVQVIDLSSLEGYVNTVGQVVIAINAQLTSNGGTLPGGWICSATGNNLTFKTLTFGEDARLLIKSDSTADTLFGLDNLTHLGTSPSGTTGDVAIDTYGIAYGADNITGAVTFTITADSVGIDGNSTSVVITNGTGYGAGGTFVFQIFNQGVQIESWGGLTKDLSSSFYVQTFISLVSDFIRVNDDVGNPAPPLDGTYHLSGGSDGIPSDPDIQDQLLIGNLVGFTGMYCLSEPEQIDIDLLAVPGHSSTAIVLAMLDLCQNLRQDCLAIVDPPFGLTVQEIIDWQNGAHPLNTVQFDSDFGALYWPWVKLYDNFNRVNVWCPPSGAVIATIARSDFLSAPWFAPAGLSRGQVPGIIDVYNRPTLEERDLMYGNSNAINPIVQFADIDGFVIWGQKTLQRLPTALDRVSVRRLMFYLEKEIRIACRQILFDPNDSVFQQRFVTICTGILNTVQIGRGLYAYFINAGSDLNTPDVIDRNEFHAEIGVQPVKAAEYIYIQFAIFPTGNFSQSATNTVSNLASNAATF